ncbi:MAG TPA: hypothetical protein ENF24_04345 [Methanosarcinales archaeon]|nr:hypothetical protein [Methanosarcinales archaeon]
MERIGDVIRNGAYTWMQNPVLCAPFLINAIAQVMFSIVVLAGVAIAIGTDAFTQIASSISDFMIVVQYADELPTGIMYELYQLITPFIRVFVAAAIVLVIGCTLIRTFFMAGAIGMAKAATMVGTTGLHDLLRHGRQSMISLFLANIAISLMFLLGIVFLVPGAVMAQMTDNIGVPLIILFMGILLFIIYIIILSLGMTPVQYALVIDHLGAIEGIEKGWSFFLDHKFDVFLICVLMIGIAMFTGLIGIVFYTHPVSAAIWRFVDVLINLCIVLPLTTAWWTRLYMEREGATPGHH